jgi:cysteine-rich repeat protein
LIQLNFLRDSILRGELFQLIDTVKLISQSITVTPRNRRLQEGSGSSGTEPLLAVLNTVLSTQMNSGLALEFVKALQALPSDPVAFNGIDSTLALRSLKKLCQDSTGYLTFSVTVPYLQLIFGNSDPSLIPEILTTATACRQRAASDVLIGQTQALTANTNAAWTISASPMFGIDIYDSSFLFDSKFPRLPKIFVSRSIMTSIRPSDMVRCEYDVLNCSHLTLSQVLVITSMFPNPWANRKGPWVTPAAGISVVNKEVNRAILESKGSVPTSTFIVTLPLTMTKVPTMSQKLSVLSQKLLPKIWDPVSNSWTETGCELLSVNETECSISCMNFGIFAVEYNADLFVCGDGVRDLIEGCDDWNNLNGDGCDSSCQVESGWSCQKGKVPSEKLGFDLCERYPCYSPYNCKSQGVCLPESVCFCDSGFFGDWCNQTLRIFSQIALNQTWEQLPFYLNPALDDEFQHMFTLFVNGTGTKGSTVAATLAVYKPEMFPQPIVRFDAFSPLDSKATTIVAFHSTFLSNIFDLKLRTAGNITVQATGRVFLSYNFSLPAPFLNFSLSNTNGRMLANSANSSIQINVCQYSVVKKVWQPIKDPFNIAYIDRRIAYEFKAVGPNYYALIATLRVDIVQPDNKPPLAQLPPPDSEYSPVVAIAAGVAGSVLLLAAWYTFWYIRRRNRRRVVLAAYYQATVAAARKYKLAADAKKQHPTSIPPPPESGIASPRKMLQNQQAPLRQPKQVAVLDASPPPPPLGSSANKSLVAAAMRSKFKGADRLKRSLPALELDQDLEFELALTQDTESFISRNSSVAEVFEDIGEAMEVESVDSDGNGERQFDASSSCSAISLADKSDCSDLEDAGIAPPIMLPLNDFEDGLESLVRPPGLQRPPIRQVSVDRPNLSTASPTAMPRIIAERAPPSRPVGTAAQSNIDSAVGSEPSTTASPREDASLISRLWKKQAGTSFDA